MRRLWGLVLTGFAAAAGGAGAQELETRLYMPSPVGFDTVSFAYAYSQGNVLLDAALPLEDVDARLHTLVAVWVRSLDVFGRSARLDVIVPFAIGDWTGLLNGDPVATSRRGFGDARARLAVNLIGAPAMTPAQFREYSRSFILGVSTQVSFPVGQYESDRLISLGANRWTLRTEVGASQRLGRWDLEGAVGFWLFGANDDYLDRTLEQQPFWAVQGHVVYNFRQGMWLSADAGYGDGGTTELDGIDKADPKTSTRLGLTFAYPLSRADGLRFTAFTGLSTRFGADFDNIAIAYARTF